MTDEHASAAPPRHVVVLPFGLRRVAPRDLKAMGGAWISAHHEWSMPWEEKRTSSYLVALDPDDVDDDFWDRRRGRPQRMYRGRFAAPTDPGYKMSYSHDASVRLASQEQIDTRIGQVEANISAGYAPLQFNPKPSIRSAFWMGLVAFGVMAWTGYLVKGGWLVALGLAAATLLGVMLSDYIPHRRGRAARAREAEKLARQLNELPRTPQVSARAIRWRGKFGKSRASYTSATDPALAGDS
ncbi:hypothetical protein ASE14_12125 [Agromyces sp. Root81]|uniref:hypothetical protein n=1 Tax=Agromyces sp. Root81 TaxID=1736601 RepID=UPI0006FAAD37|nr:hypothetical protein [Agromyces sp. Root81]KRC61583.1 hypothetical protein ASE14_12125 [Agromyces sp. Root81]